MVAHAAGVRRAVRERRREIRGDVVRDHRVGLVVLINLALELVAARLAEHLALHARGGHLGALRDRAEEDLFERAVVDVEAGAARAFRRVDAFDEDAVLAAVAVGRIAGLRAGTVAADVDAAHRHGRRQREQRPEVARVRDFLQRFKLEVLLDARGRGVDDRRRAGDRHGLLQRCHGQFDVDRRCEAHPDLDAFALQRVEAGQLVGHGVAARRQRRKAVEPAGISDRRLHAHHRRARGVHRHARQNAATAVGNLAVDGAGGACAATLRERVG